MQVRPACKTLREVADGLLQGPCSLLSPCSIMSPSNPGLCSQTHISALWPVRHSTFFCFCISAPSKCSFHEGGNCFKFTITEGSLVLVGARCLLIEWVNAVLNPSAPHFLICRMRIVIALNVTCVQVATSVKMQGQGLLFQGVLYVLPVQGRTWLRDVQLLIKGGRGRQAQVGPVMCCLIVFTWKRSLLFQGDLIIQMSLTLLFLLSRVSHLCLMKR